NTTCSSSNSRKKSHTCSRRGKVTHLSVSVDATEPGVACIYTHGSGINGHVGSAAAMINPPVNDISLKYLEYICTSVSSTVNEAELKGLYWHYK
ncbi:hypothetical protein LZ32DRAFT_674094, partial [Colletotrichum eremochloae]